MNTREERNIIITMSPEELRRLADKMDKLYPKATIGQSTFVDFLHNGPTFKVSLHLDQEYYQKYYDKDRTR